MKNLIIAFIGMFIIIQVMNVLATRGQDALKHQQNQQQQEIENAQNQNAENL